MFRHIFSELYMAIKYLLVAVVRTDFLSILYLLAYDSKFFCKLHEK